MSFLHVSVFVVQGGGWPDQGPLLLLPTPLHSWRVMCPADSPRWLMWLLLFIVTMVRNIVPYAPLQWGTQDPKRDNWPWTRISETLLLYVHFSLVFYYIGS